LDEARLPARFIAEINTTKTLLRLRRSMYCHTCPDYFGRETEAQKNTALRFRASPEIIGKGLVNKPPAICQAGM